MHGLGEFQMIREHRDELLREAERRRLVRELRASHRKEPLHLRGHVGAALRAWRRKPSTLSARPAR